MYLKKIIFGPNCSHRTRDTSSDLNYFTSLYSVVSQLLLQLNHIRTCQLNYKDE